MITSDVLGYAFEPEQRFENPDGTAITFDTDYLGEHRGLSVMPGPFASAEAAGKQLWQERKNKEMSGETENVAAPGKPGAVAF